MKKKLCGNTREVHWIDEELYGIPIQINSRGEMKLRKEALYRKNYSVFPKIVKQKSYQTLIDLAMYLKQQKIQVSKCSRLLLCEIISRRLGIPKKGYINQDTGIIKKEYSQKVRNIASILLFLSMWIN